MHGGVNAQVYVFLKLALNEGERLASRLGCFTHGLRTVGISYL
jgi:hypothetical protein